MAAQDVSAFLAAEANRKALWIANEAEGYQGDDPQAAPATKGRAHWINARCKHCRLFHNLAELFGAGSYGAHC